MYFFFLFLLIFIAIITALFSSKGIDRIIITNMISIYLLSALALYSYYTNELKLIDLIIIYIICSPVASIVILIYSKNNAKDVILNKHE